MAKFKWFTPGRFNDLCKSEDADGMHLVIELSPYETPKGVGAGFDEKTKRFVMDFRYIDEEPSKSCTLPNGIEITEGRHTGKLLSIAIPTDNATYKNTYVIELQAKILDALKNRFAASKGGVGRELNINAAKSVIDKDLRELVGQ